MKADIKELMRKLDALSDSEMLAAALDEIAESERDNLSAAKIHFIKESACQIRSLWELALSLSKHQEIDEHDSLLMEPISSLSLPHNIQAILIRNDMEYVVDLTSKSRTYLLKIEGIGKKALSEIEDSLEHYGLSLKKDD